jgi:hypothetical protein
MSRLAEIYRQEKKSGGGLTSTITKRLGEKIDPRQMLDSSGIIATMFPGLKPYSATKQKTPSATSSMPSISSGAGELSIIAEATKITAKNSIVLPSMARDMFLVKQNIIKLVKSSGGKPQTKSGDFFNRQQARESAFEQQMAAMGRKSGSVGASGGIEQKDGKSFLDKIGAIFGFPMFGKKAPVPPTPQSKGAYKDPKTGKFAKRPPPATVASRLGGLSTTLARALPFLSTTLAPVLGVAGLAGLLYYMIKSDTGQAPTSDEIDKDNLDFTPEQQIKASSSLNTPATDDEIRKARENMRASDNPDERAAAAKLDVTNPLPTISPSPQPVITQPQPNVSPVPSNVVTSDSGSPIMTGAGVPLTSGESSPSKVSTASIPSASGIPIDYQSYAQKIGEKESKGKYDAVNTLGYLGKYQFGALALQDMKLVKQGTSLKGLDDPANWNIEGGKKAFLNNPQLQEDTMVKYTKQNFATLNRIGVINNKSSQQEIAGYLAASHLLGPGGAQDLAKGKVGSDAYGTSSATYFKVGSATQGIGSGGTSAVASAPAPTSGATIASASTAAADARQATGGGGSVVVDNSQRTTVASSQPSGKPTSAYDRDILSILVSGIAA